MTKRTKRKLVINGKPNDQSVAVGWSDSNFAIAWFWDMDGENPLKNAREYVKWKQRRTTHDKSRR